MTAHGAPALVLRAREKISFGDFCRAFAGLAEEPQRGINDLADER